jgi:hypothetical protein
VYTQSAPATWRKRRVFWAKKRLAGEKFIPSRVCLPLSLCRPRGILFGRIFPHEIYVYLLNRLIFTGVRVRWHIGASPATQCPLDKHSHQRRLTEREDDKQRNRFSISHLSIATFHSPPDCTRELFTETHKILMPRLSRFFEEFSLISIPVKASRIQ